MAPRRIAARSTSLAVVVLALDRRRVRLRRHRPQPPSAAAARRGQSEPTQSPPAPAVANAGHQRRSFDPTRCRARRSRPSSTASTQPIDLASPGDGSGRVFVVEQPGGSGSSRTARWSTEPFLDIRDRISSGGERGLLGLAFHPDFPADPRFFVNYTDRRRRHGRRRIPARRGRRGPATRDPSGSCSRSTSPSRTTTAARSSSGRTGCSTSPRATAARAATRRAMASGSTRCSARSSGSTSTRTPDDGRAYRDPRRQPVPGRRRRQARDLAHRPAQPVADALRRRDRRPVDRRRRPGRLGGDRRGAGRRRAASTSAGTGWRGSTASSRASGCDETGPDPAGRGVRPRARLRGHRWRGRPRPGPAGCSTAGTCSPTRARATSGCSTRQRPSRRTRRIVGETGRSISAIELDEDGTVLATDLGRASSSGSWRRRADARRATRL